MHYSLEDADKHKPGLNPKQKKKWARIANGVIRACMNDGGDDKKCSDQAVKMANLSFEDKVFNPVMKKVLADQLKDKIFEQKQLITHIDPQDGHVHMAYVDEYGNGATDVGGTDTPHTHSVYGFAVMPFQYWNPEDSEDSYSSMHPGSIAFVNTKNKGVITDDQAAVIAQRFGKTGSIEEMEIFRSGTHNGDEFTEDDLEEIAENFRKLKFEVKPKLKITHRENQKTLAGLASYGDIVEVYTKKDEDGKRRLYARVENVPEEVLSWIDEGRFTERSIEIYPSFKLGTRIGDETEYHNVLKAIALLGHEMPAVSGMEPIKLSENLEIQKTVCIGEVCFPCEEMAENYKASLAAVEIIASSVLRSIQ